MTLAEALEVLRAYLAYLESDGGKWPLMRERPILTNINTWVALYEGDHDRLRRIRSWDARRGYRVDPLAERIADAWASYLVGEDPSVRAYNEVDQGLMDDLLGNDFPSELERMASLLSAEGEQWARIYVDPLVADRPILDWVSRLNIVPMWQGYRLGAVGVVSELPATNRDPKGTVYRHFEVHVTGHVFNVLYRGTDSKLGERQPAMNHPAVEDLELVWEHNLPGIMLERIPNKLRRDKRIGVSDFRGILDPLLDLNEASAIGAHNMRLTARQRAVISQAVAQAQAGRQRNDLADDSDTSNGNSGIPRPRFDPSEEIFVNDPLDDELGKTSDPFRVLSYSFDADALIAWKRDLVETAITRAGMSAQYTGIGAGNEGYAISGTALRLKLIPTDRAGASKGRYIDDALPRILRTMALVETLPRLAGGFDRGWTDPTGNPTFERADGIPADPVERAQTDTAYVNAGLLSVETSLRERYPEWDDDKIGEEVARIRADRAAAPSAMLGGTGF